MITEVIKSFLVSLSFGVDDSSIQKFNKAIASSVVRITALVTSIQGSAVGVLKGISLISDGFEKLGYETRLLAPAISKTFELRKAMFEAYNRAGIDLVKVINQSVKFNMSLAKTKFALEAIYKSVGAKFIPVLTKQLDVFRSKLYGNLPKIQAGLEKMIKFLLKAFDATVLLGNRIWNILGRVWDFFAKLDEATDGWSTKILLVVAAWKLLNLSFLASPLGLILTGLLAILALYDDFKTFQEGGKSLINWGSDATKVITGVIASVGALGAAILSIMGVIRTVAAIQWLWNAALSANPIGIIIIAITSLIALLTVLAAKMGYLKSISGFFSGIGEKILGTVNPSAGSPSSGSSKAYAGISNVLGGGGGGSAGALAGITQPNPIVGNTSNASTQHVNQETNINIQGSADANSTAKAVSNEQGKVNFDMTRNLKGATR